mmetsp:Transcript_20580/g.41374  ORF Transcript_20580/g.41374 Transcript_20580/m.41374 type:complete len:209 (+) Transcript_20580:1282-1908(+)
MPVQLAHRAHVNKTVVAGHIHVEAVVDGIGVIVHREPVRNYEPVEAHSPLQVAFQQVRVGATVRAVHFVIGAHHGADTRFHRGLKRRVVQLPCGSGVHINAVVEPVEFLLVESPMLCHAHDASALRAANVRARHPRTQVRVFARDVLEVAPAPCRAVNLHTGPEEHVRALALELACDGLGDCLDELGVPSGGQPEHRGPSDDGSGYDT